MAAFVVNTHGRNITNNLTKILNVSSFRKEFKRSNYIVLLPEIPPDTSETNPLLRSEALPDFSNLTSINCYNAVGKLLIQVESQVCRLEEKLSDGKLEKNFENVIHPLEVYSTPLSYAFSTMNALGKITNDNKLIEATLKLYGRVQKSQSSAFQSLPIYHAVKELDSNRKKLSECQQRVLEKFLVEGKLRGCDLPLEKKGHYRDLVINIEREKDTFRSKIDRFAPKFRHTLSHPSMVEKFPEHIIKKMAADKLRPKNGPWYVTLEKDVYKTFLENCSDRMLRWNLWQAKSSLVSTGEINANNSVGIEEIRSKRLQLAKLLGYKTFAEMSMSTKMAGNTENVKTMITTLHLKSKAVIENELLELQEFAMQNGFNGELELWDVPYYREQQKQHNFKLDDSEISQYFPLPSVINGLFSFCHRLFGITIQDCTTKAATWNPDVKYYEVIDENKQLRGSFFLEPYLRTGQKQTEIQLQIWKTRNVVAKMEPLSYLTLNLPPPILSTNRNSCLLTFQQVETLFEKFGLLLQHSLTTAPYSSVSGLNNVEWDAIGIVPAFMKLWLQDYKTVASISSHIHTGEVITQEMHKTIRKAEKHMAAFDLTQELYLGALDLELYTRNDFWLDVMRDVWAELMPLPLDKVDSHPCSFKEIFCDEYPASYFSHTWAKMIAADAFSSFYEAGLSNEDEIKVIGRRFRDTFLCLGGGCAPGEVFRRFRGRNPSLETLLVISGITKSKKKDL